MELFSSLSPIQSIGITISGLLLTSLVLYFLLKEQKSIRSSDGTSFSTQEACDAYESLSQRINALYKDIGEKKAKADLLGLEPVFLSLLKEKGFSNAKQILKYRNDFIRLASIIEE